MAGGLGHATVQVGLKRSTLVSEELEQAQERQYSEPHDAEPVLRDGFADQLENIILPALKAGFIVLADRYIYTLMARDMVRGMDETWLKNLYGIALEPDAVFYLNVAPGGTGPAHFRKKRGAGLLGERHGLGPVARHVRQLSEVSDGYAEQLSPFTEDLWVHHCGRHAIGRDDKR